MHDAIYQKMLDRGYVDIVGGGEPRENGRINFALLDKHLSLNPAMNMLEFGCGCGRLSLPVLEYLDATGSYTGVDIIPELVSFCRDEIASCYPNSSFFRLLAENSHYSDWTEDTISESFDIQSLEQLDSESFDAIVAFSVFTHLSDTDYKHYLQQFGRLLKPQGHLLISTFLINDASRHYLEQESSLISFKLSPFRNKNVYYSREDDKLGAVAFNENFFNNTAIASKLEPVSTYYGNWCGRMQPESMQDIVVFRKMSSLPEGFNVSRYLELNPDLPWDTESFEGKANTIRHYLHHGYFENRRWK